MEQISLKIKVALFALLFFSPCIHFCQDSTLIFKPLELHHRRFYMAGSELTNYELEDLINNYPNEKIKAEIRALNSRINRNKIGRNLGLGFSIFLVPFTAFTTLALTTTGHGATTFLVPYFATPLLISCTLTIFDGTSYLTLRRKLIKKYNYGLKASP